MVQTAVGVEESRFMSMSLAGVQSVMILGIFMMVMSFAMSWVSSMVPKK